MKCLFCSSEASPFISTGGLGDVAGSLPAALIREKIDCRTVIPMYSGIPEKLKNNAEFIESFAVPVAWRSQYCGLYRTEYKGTPYYLIDNKYYFGRENVYGYYDDAERFAFFSRACLELLKYIDFHPDIIHCNDWQTALIPVYLRSIYSTLSQYREIKTVYTIHNLQYQGKYGMDILEEVVGIPKEWYNLLEFDMCANFMKGGIEASSAATAVSPSYAREIMLPEFSHGLDPILRLRENKLTGILNGIDTSVYNPKTDPMIYFNYSAEDLSGKKINKSRLRQRLFLEDKEDVPLIGMVTRLVSHKGIDLVTGALERLLDTENMQFVILGSGEEKYQKYFSYIQNKYKGRASACTGFVPELSHKIYAASDMFLMPSYSEPCGLSQMTSLKYGSIPIVRETGGLADTIKDSGDGLGNGFTFKKYDCQDMINAVRRALAGYRDKEGWELLTVRAMSEDNSWDKSASRYLNLYKSLKYIS